MANFLSRMFRPSAVRAAEGQYHDGPWTLPISGGWLPADVGRYMNWWQLGHNVQQFSTSAMVEACVSAYAQTVAMCPGDHWRRTEAGGRERVITSALTRILRAPNGYQTISDFMLNGTRSLYLDGNTYALALRNDRFEIAELHLMNPRQCAAQLAETGDIFYHLSGNDVIDRRLGGAALIVPARDVLHIRLHTPRNPLRGETPLLAAALDVAAGDAMGRQQLAFYINQARPAQVLSTDERLTADQVKELRGLWNEQSQGLAAGGTPILTAGLKPLPLAGNAKDAQLADMMKMGEQHIALAFRVPLQILGIGGTPFASTEALMQSWRASGLGFALNHIEEAFGRLFGLKGQPDEYLEFNTKALLRSSFKDRIDGLVHGVQGGIYSPDEARAEEEMPEVPGGHGKEPRVQQQVVPLSAAGKIPAAPPAPPAPAVPPPAKDSPNGQRSGEWARSLLRSADEHDRRAA